MINDLDYRNKNVLVTGGSGFIGKLVCEKLLEVGAKVHSASRSVMQSGNAIHWWQGDLSDINFVRGIFNDAKPEIIFHLASEVTGKREIGLVLPTLNGNLISAVNLLVCATEQGCERIILAGSLEEPDVTDTNPVPCSPYAAAKWASSAYARMFYALYKTPVTMARLFMVYGPHQKDLAKLIPYVCLSLIKKEVPSLANGKRLVDWVFVDDVVHGLLRMGITSGVENQTIDLGTGLLSTTGEVAERLCAVDGNGVLPNFGALPERPMEQVKKANVDKTESLLKWKPEISLSKGLEATYSWYKEQVALGKIKL